MNKIEIVLISIIVIPLFTGCNLSSDKVFTYEERLRDSLRTDSIRQVKCDSLLNYISETNSGSVNLPDKLPTTLDECIVQLDTCTNDTLKAWMRCVTEPEYTAQLHFGFGMYLRNNWGLWGGSELSKFFNTNQIFHPDDMSGIILSCFHEFVNTGKYSITDKVAYYKAYWKQMEAQEDSTIRNNSEQ